MNFLLGKVGKLHITSCVNHVSREANAREAPHAIVPDIHAHNFLVRKQTINDNEANRAAEAFFEVKTSTACKTRYDHNNNHIHLVDRCTKLICQSYWNKLKNLTIF